MRRCQSSSLGKKMPINRLLDSWKRWAGRLHDRARVGIVDSHGSVLLLKKKVLPQD